MENIPNLQEILTNITAKLIAQVVNFAPKLVTTIAVIFIGYWIAKLIALVFNKILTKIGIDKISEKLQEISIIKQSKLKIKFSFVISKALYYFILLVFITTATEILGVSALTDIIHSIVNFIPRLISGAIMLIVGLVVAEAIKNGVVTLCKSFNIRSGRLIGNAVFFFFLTVLILGVLAQIVINTDLLESTFNIFVGGIILAFSIGYGIASRDVLANILASFYSKGKYTEGQKIRVDAVEGIIIAIDNTSLTVQTKESTVVLPLQFLQSKKSILMTVFLSATMLTAYSQDAPKAAVAAIKDTSYWKKASSFALNYNSGSFSQNWAGGAVNSVAFGVILNSKGDYEKGPITWTNDFQFQYGTLWNKTQGDWRKSIDRLFFDSKVGRKINSKWNFFASLNFISQIATGYKFGKADQKLSTGQVVQVETSDLVSNLFAPAYITEAIGFEYKPNKFFSLQLAPIAMRQTIVADKNLYKTFPLNYGLKQGNTFKNDLGVMQVVANYDKDIMKDVNLKARYQFFTSYPTAAIKEVDPNAKIFSSSVNRLDAQLTAKVAKYFNVNVGLIGLYDQTQSFDVQLAQSIGVGFLYKW